MARLEVGIRELKQNPSEVISRAEAGSTFSVLRNGKPTRVVITAEAPARSRWVSAEVLSEALEGLGTDTTGWLDELELDRASDPIVNPWDASA